MHPFLKLPEVTPMHLSSLLLGDVQEIVKKGDSERRGE